MGKIYSKEYEVSSMNINIGGRLGLYGLLSLMQDAAALHAEELGFGIRQMLEKNSFWVMAQQSLKVKRWPHWQDQIQIRTWPRKPEGFKTYRDFQIFMGGDCIAECTTLFMALDGLTRKPAKSAFYDDLIALNIDEALELETQKILPNKEAELVNTITVRNSDIDVNRHVNNTKYSQWTLDSIPLTTHSKYKIFEFDINFTAETFLGDEIEIYHGVEFENDEIIHSNFYGKRKSDQKLVFSALYKSFKLKTNG